MIELEARAVALLVDRELQLKTGVPAPLHNALGPLRLALLKPSRKPAQSNTPVYRVSCRREQAEALLTFSRAVAEVLVTFPDEDDRAESGLLQRAARAIADARNLS